MRKETVCNFRSKRNLWNQLASRGSKRLWVLQITEWVTAARRRPSLAEPHISGPGRICRTLIFSKLERSLLFNFWSRGHFLFSITEGVSHRLPKNMSQYPKRFLENWLGLIGIISLEDISLSLSQPQSLHLLFYSSPLPSKPDLIYQVSKMESASPKKGFLAFLEGGIFCPA